MAQEVHRDAFIGIVSGYLASLVSSGYGLSEMITLGIILSLLPTAVKMLQGFQTRIENWEGDESGDGERVEHEWSTNRAS